MTKNRGRPPHNDVLTPAEWRVIEAARHGMTNPKIAKRLNVSIDAVKFHIANALLKLGLKNKRELRLWDGVAKSSGLQKGNIPMQDITLGKIGQIARTVKDISAAESFFRDKLQIPHLFTFGNLAFFDCDGSRLFLSEGDGDSSDSVLYFRVEDIHAARDELTSRGVKFIDAPHMIHKHESGVEEWMSFFEDNEGRPLALMAQTRPT